MDEKELLRRAAAIKMIVLDVDGVMTDGRVYIQGDGLYSKAFDIRDGFGIVLARRAGITFAIITGLKSSIVTCRAEQLGIQEVHQGFVDKIDVLNDIVKRHDIGFHEVAYMGDDLFDIPVLRKVGLASAPADADADVIKEVHWVSKFGGGRGAVRELIEMIIKARGQWEQMLKEFVKV